MDGRRAEHQKGSEPGAGLVLAGVDRAARHRLPEPGPAPMFALLEHLAVARRSSEARQVRLRLQELERDGRLERRREHGLPVWSLTAAGRRSLRSDPRPLLPESPRHRAWRHARALAAQELPRFRARLAEAINETELMLDLAGEGQGPAGRLTGDASSGGAPSAEAWLQIGHVLAADCGRLASAWHCLREWDEPGDDDLAAPGDQAWDPVRRAQLAALRNIRLWREPD